MNRRALGMLLLLAWSGCGRVGLEGLSAYADSGPDSTTPLAEAGSGAGDGARADAGQDAGDGAVRDAGRLGGGDGSPQACVIVADAGGAPVESRCDGLDDDCDGRSDEAYVAVATDCGQGACATQGRLRCVGAALQDSCTPGAPLASFDSTPDGIDEDCDGHVDEDIATCGRTTQVLLTPGAYPAVVVPGGCGRVTVRLWGAGGAAGGDTGAVSGGVGGAGGHAAVTVPVTGTLSVYVGNGAPACVSGGTTGDRPEFGGGTGGQGVGGDGADGMVAGGARGGQPSMGDRGGNGFYGGGGGGRGRGGLGASGSGGGGGAASGFYVGGALVALAGGGGGGGGAQSVSILGTLSTAGSPGGSGCARPGGAGDLGGGGGGGGACRGSTTLGTASRMPASGRDLPPGQASGGESACASGGGGFAILNFSQ